MRGAGPWQACERRRGPGCGAAGPPVAKGGAWKAAAVELALRPEQMQGRPRFQMIFSIASSAVRRLGQKAAVLAVGAQVAQLDLLPTCHDPGCVLFLTSPQKNANFLVRPTTAATDEL